MDLDFIQEQLDTFSTFGGNIGDALQLIPNLLSDLWAFITGFEENLETTNGLSDNLSSTEIGENAGDDTNTAEDNGSLGSSSAEDDAEGTEDAGSSQE